MSDQPSRLSSQIKIYGSALVGIFLVFILVATSFGWINGTPTSGSLGERISGQDKLVEMGGTSSQDGSLLWRFSEGDHYEVEMLIAVTVEMELFGEKMTTGVKATSFMDWITRDVDRSQNADVALTLRRMAMVLDIPMVGSVSIDSSELDSDDPLTAEVASSLSNLIDAEITFTISPRGGVSNLKIPQEFVTGAFTETLGMSAEQFGNVVEQISPEFPTGELAVGDTWTDSQTIEVMEMTTKSDTTYTFAGVVDHEGRDLNEITYETLIDISGPEGMGNVTISDQSSSGRILFDNVAGRVVTNSLKQVWVMNVAVGEGQSIEQKISQDITYLFNPKE